MTRPGEARRRRWLAGGLVAAWVAALGGLAMWSVGHEPATVPEQRDIGQAVPRLQEATGVVLAAAGGPGRAVVLDELVISRDCRVTPVRAGVAATRDVVVHVRAGEARAMVEALAAALPAGYAAEVAAVRAGTELSLHADAGDFIGVDVEAASAARVVTVRLSTGCRPLADGAPDGADGAPDGADPAAGPAPALLGEIVAALGAASARQPAPPPTGMADVAEVRAVACPGGGSAATWMVETSVPVDVGARMRAVLGAGGVVREDDDVLAYRSGDDSVVIERDGDRGRVSLSTGC